VTVTRDPSEESLARNVVTLGRALRFALAERCDGIMRLWVAVYGVAENNTAAHATAAAGRRM
jgi:hypothetical protein